MDDFEKMLDKEYISPQLKSEIKLLNKRQNRLTNKICNILRNVRSNNFVEPQKLGIALDNLEAYFEQLRAINNEQNDIIQGLIKRIIKIEGKAKKEKDKVQADKALYDDVFPKNYKYYNRTLPKLNKFRGKNNKK